MCSANVPSEDEAARRGLNTSKMARILRTGARNVAANRATQSTASPFSGAHIRRV